MVDIVWNYEYIVLSSYFYNPSPSSLAVQFWELET